MIILLAGALGLNVYAALLVVLRAQVFHTRLYRPMLWNIFLSIMPIVVLVVAVLASVGLIVVARPLGYVSLGLGAVIWLLMLPNASYLITELNQSHRVEDDPVPLWFDIILVISLAMSGVVNTVTNVFIAHAIFAVSAFGDETASFTKWPSIVAVGLVLLAVSFGMYLGRYIRVNSWDIRHPGGLFRRVIDHFREGAALRAAIGFTVTYAVFLALIYVVVAGPVIDGLTRLEALR